MKRDMDLVRSILFLLEERSRSASIQPEAFPIEGSSAFEIQYHVNLLYQAGFINGEPTRSSTSDRLISVLPFDLTWQGHEFLEAVRDPEIWRRAKDGAASAGSASVELIWSMAKALIGRAIKDKIGLDLV
jgi:hypothetical protein